jgi:NitT/TauT family transport system substrate-binding protein
VKQRNKGVIILLLMFVIAITGCGANNAGSGAAENSSAAGAANTAAATTETEAAGQNGAQELTEITVAMTASGIAYGPMYLAQEEDIWAKYGLKVNLVSLDVSAITAGLITGQVPIAFSGANVVDAAIKSENVKVGGTIGSVPYMLYAKGIDSIDQLKGKVVGASAPGGNNEYAMLTMLRSAGLTPGEDVEVLYVGASILPTISEGKVAAGLLVPPMSFQAEEMGLTKLATLSELDGIQGDYMIGGVNVPFAEKNPGVVENFFKAYAEASKLTQTEKEKTMAALSTWTKVTDTDSLDRAYEYFKEYWPTDFHVPEEEVQFLLDELGGSTNPDAKNVKPADIIVDQYADAVQ